MKKLYAHTLTSCLYTVLMTLFLCVFSSITDGTRAYISVDQFLLVLLFGVTLSVSTELLHYEKWPLLVRRLLHYAVVTTAFILIAVFTGKLDRRGATIIVAIVLFSIVYALFVLAGWLIKKNTQGQAKKKTRG
ncbi:MAG: DUF3021 family protein [Clostridia bacterium]|nr:DUF3021 family protein [Clostridia bacterium]